ncbi:hypothetical protein V8E36_006593 [Tilletia maclaganii]
MHLSALAAAVLSLSALVQASHSSRPFGVRHNSAGVDNHKVMQRQEPQPGDTIYLNSPACGYFQCNVSYVTGDLVTVNWINAPENGNVLISLMTNNSEVLAYNITTAPPTVPTNFCDSDEGLGKKVAGRTCGRVEFRMPSSVNTGNYSFRAISLPPAKFEDTYTDVILVNKTRDDVPFKLLDLKGADNAVLAPTGAGYPSSAGGGNASAPASTSTSSSTPAAGASTGTTAPPPETSASSSPASTHTIAGAGTHALDASLVRLLPVGASVGLALVAGLLCVV